MEQSELRENHIQIEQNIISASNSDINCKIKSDNEYIGLINISHIFSRRRLVALQYLKSSDPELKEQLKNLFIDYNKHICQFLNIIT